MWWKELNVNVLEGKTLEKIKVKDNKIIFTVDDGTKYKMFHDQCCCEQVYIEDICGDIKNLIGSHIVMAEEVSNYDIGKLDKWDDSYTWTFYKFATIKGYVTIRWYGTSNGWYSEKVDFIELEGSVKW